MNATIIVTFYIRFFNYDHFFVNQDIVFLRVIYISAVDISCLFEIICLAESILKCGACYGALYDVRTSWL